LTGKEEEEEEEESEEETVTAAPGAMKSREAAISMAP
jgi:hypothetical protein